MPYAEVGDLLFGDIPLGSGVDPQVWVDRAAEEIDSRIGQRYELPLPASLAPHSLLLLKRINAQLGTGRLLMAIDGDGDNDLHAYGLHLVQMALADLQAIVMGSIDLVGGVVADVGDARGPSIINQDAYSATAAFEAFTMAGADAYWRPGG